jgi:hypothetical protein
MYVGTLVLVCVLEKDIGSWSSMGALATMGEGSCKVFAIALIFLTLTWQSVDWDIDPARQRPFWRHVFLCKHMLLRKSRSYEIQETAPRTACRSHGRSKMACHVM